jgi:hypothetical protein
MSEIETDHIYIEKVIKREIGIYRIDANSGLLSMDPPAAESIVKNKQLAILSGDWILAHYPPRRISRFAFSQGRNQQAKLKTEIVPAYFVVANIKTGEWTIDVNSPLAKTAGADALLKRLREFYPGEV